MIEDVMDPRMKKVQIFKNIQGSVVLILPKNEFTYIFVKTIENKLNQFKYEVNTKILTFEKGIQLSNNDIVSIDTIENIGVISHMDSFFLFNFETMNKISLKFQALSQNIKCISFCPFFDKKYLVISGLKNFNGGYRNRRCSQKKMTNCFNLINIKKNMLNYEALQYSIINKKEYKIFSVRNIF